MTIYGYVRVSSTEQNEGRQMAAMKKAGIAFCDIFIDKQSGKDFVRPAYGRMTELLRPGDLLYIQSIDRLGRDYDEIQNQWRLLTKERGIDIAVIDMPLLNTRREEGDLMGTFIADLVLQILSFVAQSEREAIHKRQAEGIVAAQQRGVRFGRPKASVPDNFETYARLWERRQVSLAEVLRACHMSRTTFYRRYRVYQRCHQTLDVIPSEVPTRGAQLRDL
jgi:DNA invertase Pin-like site-specific DNA recombinase